MDDNNSIMRFENNKYDDLENQLKDAKDFKKNKLLFE
jgi:hypothetical protein